MKNLIKAGCYALALGMGVANHARAESPTANVAAPSVVSATQSVSAVETTPDFAATPELEKAVALLRVPEGGRFAFTWVGYNQRSGERQALRFDPRLPSGERWSVVEAPKRMNKEKVQKKVRRLFANEPNPDYDYVAYPTDPKRMIFYKLGSEDQAKAVYGFKLKSTETLTEEKAGKLNGWLTIDRATGRPTDILLESTDKINSGMATIKSYAKRFTLTEISGCCYASTQQQVAAQGSALLIEKSVQEVEMLENVEYVTGVPMDPPAEKKK